MSNQEPAATPEISAVGGGVGPRKIHRVQIGVNVVVQLFLFAAIVVGVNWMSFRHYWRWDFSRDQKYALSSQTTNLLKGIPKPVRAIVFFSSDENGIYPDVLSLLNEYKNIAGASKFTVEEVAPYRNLTRAKELADQYKFSGADSIVILDYDGRHKFVNAKDVVELDRSPMMSGQMPVVTSFKGEQAITSAILEIVEEKQKKIYFVAGHGEPAPVTREIGQFRQFLERQNVTLDTVNLNNVESVPQDAEALIIFNPRSDYSEREVNLLHDYWGKKGHLLILLSPATQMPRFNGWLASQGIELRGDRVLTYGTQLQMAPDGTLQSHVGTNAMQIPAAIPAGASEVVKELAGRDIQLLGATQSINLDQAKSAAQKVQFVPLLESNDRFWGETEFVSPDLPAYFDRKKDFKGPLTLGVTAEKGAIGDPHVKVATARMVVIGNSDAFTDDGVQMAGVAVTDLVVNIANWIIKREIAVGIPPKEKKPVALNLPKEQMDRLTNVIVFLIPLIAIIIGLNVWCRRADKNMVFLNLGLCGFFGGGFVVGKAIEKLIDILSKVGN